MRATGQNESPEPPAGAFVREGPFLPPVVGRINAVIVLIGSRVMLISAALAANRPPDEMYKTFERLAVIEGAQWFLILIVAAGVFASSPRIRLPCLAIAGAQALMSTFLPFLAPHFFANDFITPVGAVILFLATAVVLAHTITDELKQVSTPLLVHPAQGPRLAQDWSADSEYNTQSAGGGWTHLVPMVLLGGFAYAVAFTRNSHSFCAGDCSGAPLAILGAFWMLRLFSQLRSRRLWALGGACLAGFYLAVILAVQVAHDQYYWRWKPATSEDWVWCGFLVALIAGTSSLVGLTFRSMIREVEAEMRPWMVPPTEPEEQWAADTQWDEATPGAPSAENGTRNEEATDSKTPL